MKTFTRSYYESVWSTIQVYNPLFNVIKFSKVVTSDANYVESLINLIQTCRVDGLPKTLPKVSKELLIQNIKEVWSYGQSLVIKGKDETQEADFDFLFSDMSKSIFITLEDSYVHRWAGTCHLSIKGHTIPCTHLTYTVNAVNMKSAEFFIPLYSDFTKVYVASHAGNCVGCPQKKICKKRSGSLDMPDIIREHEKCSMAVPIFQCKKSCCKAYVDFEKALRLFCSNYTTYIESPISSTGVTKNVIQRNVNTSSVNHTSICVVSEYDGSEVFVPIFKQSGESKDWQGGHHASPRVHEVSEYYRRKSKKDPTLIKVRGSVRGGTKEEKAEFVKSNVKKQKVYVVK